MISAYTRLSDYFTVADLTPTSTGIDNTPSTNELPSLKKLASVLDTLKTRLGPFRIASGYRSPLVNAAVGGSSTSRHMKGEAVDIVPIGKSAEKYWTEILADNFLRNSLGEISYKKPQGSIHLSLPFQAAHGYQVVGSARLAEGSPMIYKTLSAAQEKSFLSKYNLIDNRQPSSINQIQASTAAAVQNLFKSVTPTSYTGKIYLALGLVGISAVVLIKKVRQ